MKGEPKWTVNGVATIIHLVITCIVAGCWTYNINNPHSNYEPPVILQWLLIAAYVIAHIPLGIPLLFSFVHYHPSAGETGAPFVVEFIIRSIGFAIVAGINSFLFGSLVEMTVNITKAIAAKLRR